MFSRPIVHSLRQIYCLLLSLNRFLRPLALFLPLHLPSQLPSLRSGDLLGRCAVWAFVLWPSVAVGCGGGVVAHYWDAILHDDGADRACRSPSFSGIRGDPNVFIASTSCRRLRPPIPPVSAEAPSHSAAKPAQRPVSDAPTTDACTHTPAGRAQQQHHHRGTYPAQRVAWISSRSTLPFT